MPAVIDKYGFLWTGSGSFIYDSADTTTHSVLRFDTSSSGTAFAVQVTDQANVRIYNPIRY